MSTLATPHADPHELDRAAALRLFIVMNRAVSAIVQYGRSPIEEAGLSQSEFMVLEVLYHKGPLPLGEIAERILLQTGSTTYVINQLEKKGVLIRRTCTEDRRVTFAELTDEGRTLIAQVFPRHAEALRVAMSALSRHEKRDMTEAIKRLGRFAESLK